jgi:hypothetical protein
LRDILLRDTVSRIVETDPESFQLVLPNLSLFIDKVHNGAYDPDLVRRKSLRLFFVASLTPYEDIGTCLINVVRRTAEWPSENFDPSTLLLIIGSLTKNNPTEARVWFGSCRVSCFLTEP